MAKANTQAGPADLPELVERLHAAGADAVGDFSQDELETVIDDLPLALESESIRDHLPALVARVARRHERTFRRIVEIARQDEARTPLLLRALQNLAWRGTPAEDEFAWLVQQLSRNADAEARLAAYARLSTLGLHAAQAAILDALGAIHPDEAIREMDRHRRTAAASSREEAPAEGADKRSAAPGTSRRDATEPPPPPEPESVFDESQASATDAAWSDDAGEEPVEKTVVSRLPDAPMPEKTAITRAPDLDPAPPEPLAEREESIDPAAGEATPVFDESAAPGETWDRPEEKPPDRLTVRTLLRSIEGAPVENLASRGGANGDGGRTEEPDPLDETTVADEENEPTPHVESSLSGEGGTAGTSPDEVADESSSPEAAAAAESSRTEEPRPDPLTVRTLLASLDTVLLTNAPGEEAPPEEPEPIIEEGAEVWNEEEKAPERVSVQTMLRSLETVRVKMQALEDTPPVADGGGTGGEVETVETGSGAPAAVTVAAAVESPPGAGAPRPAPGKKPWSDVDLRPLQPPDRARRLAKVRRELKTPDLKRQYLAWLLEREKDPFSVVSIRKEILEFAFEKGTYLGFDAATRTKMGRWIRERAAAEQIATPAVLAALRRATWTEGEPPQVDEAARPIVDAATGALSRVPSEERAALFNRDFTAWLFSVREFEDREVLDRYARDPHPGVAEGLFRALAAMDALTARFGGNAGQSALEIALGLWDRADDESRTGMAKAIAGGWSRGLVLDRRTFFAEFWRRYQEHEAQRPAILIALASFEKEIEEANAKSAASPARAPAPPPVPPPEPAGESATPAATLDRSGFAPPPEAPPEVTEPDAPAPAPEPPRPRPRTPFVAKEKTRSGMTSIEPAAGKPRPTPPPAPAPAPVEPSSPPAVAKPVPERPAEDRDDEGSDRFFRMMRRNMEAGMRAASPVAAPIPTSRPVNEGSFSDLDLPEEGDAVEEGVLPDEGDAVTEGSGPKAPPEEAAASRIGAPPSPSAGSREAKDDEIVLPNEPLRTLAEYTRFLKALSAGKPIDELLSAHGMDYKQYAACMNSWGKLLQSRPHLAVRMGQLLRAG